MKRLFLALLLVGANFLTPASGRAQTNPPPRYNVLFIISDDMRGDLPDAKLPNLDRLAASGVRFERGYCQFPLCNPARSSLFTGRAATHTGVLGNRTWFGDAHPEFVSLPRWFKEHGYVTARSGKVFHDGIDDADAWDEGGEARYLAGAGAETNFVKKMSQRTARQKAAGATNAVEEDAAAAFMDSEARTTHSDQTIVIPGDGHDDHDYRATTGALRLLEKYRGQPFFIAVGLSKPHSPPSAPQKFYDLYDVDKIPLPPDYAPRPTVPEGFPKLSIWTQTPSSSLPPITAISSAKKASGPRPARCSRKAHVCRFICACPAHPPTAPPTAASWSHWIFTRRSWICADCPGLTDSKA